MIITVLAQKYKSGCGKGMSCYEENGILVKLNAIIDWSNCTWPKKKVEDQEVEDKEFLGVDPELKPGDCFLLDGQVIAIDNPNLLVLLVSETGRFSLQRIYEEHIAPEFQLFMGGAGIENLTTKEVDKVPDGFTKYVVPYPLMNCFRKKFIKEEKDCLKVNFEYPEILVFPCTVYLQGWNMYFPPEIEDVEIMTAVAPEVLSYIFGN